MGFGVVVGVLVQWIVVPPLYFGEARARLSVLRGALSLCLLEAAAVIDGESEDEGALAGAVDQLVILTSTIEGEVQEARRSQRANPRARHRHTERATLDEQFQALWDVTLYVRSVADFAEQLRPPQCGQVQPCEQVQQCRQVRTTRREMLGEAAKRCRELIDGDHDDTTSRTLASQVEKLLDEHRSRVHDCGDGEPATGEQEIAVSACLRRIVVLLSVLA